MAHACSPVRESAHQSEHPGTAFLAVLAIFLAMSLITWAALEIHGTDRLESVVAEPDDEAPALPRVDSRPEEERELDAAVTSSRWATGLSP